MSMKKGVWYGKEHREPYRDSRRFDYSCRHGGSCQYCSRNRQINRIKTKLIAKDELKNDA